MEIVRKVWRDTDLLKYHIINGDPFAVKKNNAISRFINLSGRDMEELKIEKDYWDYYTFKIDLKDVFEKEKNDEIDYNGLDSMGIEYKEDIDDKEKKKKRKHRKRKKKDNGKSKAKSVEPMEDGQEDIDINISTDIKSDESSTDDVDFAINNINIDNKNNNKGKKCQKKKKK